MASRWTGLTRRRKGLLVILLALALPARAAELMITEATALEFDVSKTADKIVLAVLGRLWLMPAAGGEAEPLTSAALNLTAPRFSPDGRRIAATGDDGTGFRHIWIVDAMTGEAERLSDGLWHDGSPAWHPAGQRLAFVSDRSGSQDIWEYDLGSGESLRLTTAPGDETGPAWYPGGDRMLYVARAADRWSLNSQFFRGRPQTLLETATRIAAPSIRPDGGVITYVADERPGGMTLKMLIPVREMVVKTLIAGRDPTEQPVIWTDNRQYLAALDGKLVRRTLGARGEQPVPFTAWLSIPEPATVMSAGTAAPTGTQPFPFVLRADRMFDAVTASYQSDRDLLIEGGRIRTIAPRRDWGDTLIIDMGDATVLPGLIDIDAPGRGNAQRSGAAVLASGVTTVATLGPVTEPDDATATPAPRRVGATSAAAAYVDVRGAPDQQRRIEAIEAARAAGRAVLTDRLLPDLALGAHLLAPGTRLPRSPGGRIYGDITGLLGKARAAVVSGLVARRGLAAADWSRLRSSRLYAALAGGLGLEPAIAVPQSPSSNRILHSGGRVVAGSAESPLPAGLSLHAELLSLQADGLQPHEAIRSATLDAAEALGLGAELGSIAEGRIADLIVVSGDPLADVADLLDPIAVVQGGRFLSTASLLDAP